MKALWRIFMCWIRGHEWTNSGPDYQPPICRTCALDKLYHDSQEGRKP